MAVSASSCPLPFPSKMVVGMECVVRTDLVKDWLSGSGQLAHSAPSSSSLCSTMCRRAASFPVVNRRQPVPSLLKVRSQSESEALNRLGMAPSRLTIADQLKRRQQCPSPGPIVEESSPHTCSSQSSVDVSEEASPSPSKESADPPGGAENDDTVTVARLEGETRAAPDAPDADADLLSRARTQKCVRFADDCGQELATVRVMTEPSDYPPAISPSVIRRLLGKSVDDEEDDEAVTGASWVVDFKQPASEYVKFRETLERGMVALENVMLRNDICHLVGTVKVKNIAFEKKVFVRYSSDGWKSYMDAPAPYQASPSKGYDRFNFNIAIPSNGSDPKAKIEFCICFEASPSGNSEPQRFWDSNNGKNYLLRSPDSLVEHRQVPPLFGRQDLNDAYLSDYENWTNFASWKNLSTEGPYW